MKVRVEELSPIERKLFIEVEPQRVTEELDRAYKLLSRQVKIAGFRPGKVPRRILEQRFAQEVLHDVTQRVVERAYLEAIREQKVEAVSDPHVTNQPIKPNEPFSFEARVEVKPKVEAKDYKGLKLKRIEPKVDDAMVTERIEELRDRLTRAEPVQGRDVAQANDLAVIDYEATIDGKPFPGSHAEGITVEISPGELVESHIAALEGVKIGDSKEIDYAFPPDYRVEEVRSKVARFVIKLKELKTKIRPELDDEFAKQTGFETLDALKARIRADLERAEKAKAETDEREALISELIARNSFEVPRAMVERAIDMMLEGAIRSFSRGGVDVRQLGIDWQRMRDEVRPRAEVEVKGALLLDAIAQQEKLEPSEEELEKKIQALAEQSGDSAAKVRQAFKDAASRKNLAFRVREEKTIEFLKTQATYS